MEIEIGISPMITFQSLDWRLDSWLVTEIVRRERPEKEEHIRVTLADSTTDQYMRLADHIQLAYSSFRTQVVTLS